MRPVRNRPAPADDIGRSIEQVRLEPVNGVRQAVKRILRQAGIAGLVGGAAGGAAGGMAESRYHDVTGYSHNPPLVEQAEPDDPDITLPEDTEARGLAERAKRTFSRAKAATKERIKDAAGSTRLGQKYQEIRKEYSDFKQMILEMGDKLAFWLPFLLTFLAAVMITNKVIRVKKMLTQNVDPAVDRNLRSIEQSLNRVIRRVNALTDLEITSGEAIQAVRDDALELSRRFDDLGDLSA